MLTFAAAQLVVALWSASAWACSCYPPELRLCRFLSDSRIRFKSRVPTNKSDFGFVNDQLFTLDFADANSEKVSALRS